VPIETDDLDLGTADRQAVCTVDSLMPRSISTAGGRSSVPGTGTV
jgi:hypothetical protein